ncbi:DUF2510 domain-containing protein [Planotetraspora sp. GP83]|uniref:DUF2510 domain-containing protein n=1 Tax=Planotetraspora sp. GP83 TaxID=3156264 RepID=UPI003512797C
MTTTPAGWYPDPYGSPQLRWWDGSQWTDATHPREAPSQQQPQPGQQPLQQTTGQPIGQPIEQPLEQPPSQNTGPQTGPNIAPQFPPHFPPQTGQPEGRLPWGHPGQAGYPGQGGQGAYPGQGGYPGQSGYPGPAGYPGQGTYPGNTAQFSMPEFGAQPPRATPVWAWVAGGVAVVVAIALVIGGAVFLVHNRASTTIASPDTVAPTPPLDSTVPPEPSPEPSPPPLQELPQPSDGRITDTSAGLSYAFPGDPWIVPKATEVYNPRQPAELPVWTSGYTAISQQNYDGKNGDWVGSVFAGKLPQVVPYGGPQDLRNLTGALLVNYEPVFYSPPHERKVLRNQAIKVSGHQAWLVEFEMDFSKQSKANHWKWKTEKGAFVLVDLGQGQRPALLYMSVPDNLDQSVLKRVLDSLEAR